MKIAKIIDSCHDCQHCIVSKAQKTISFIVAKEYHFATCVKEGILLYHGTKIVNEQALNIPENCPLEEYKTDKK
jgi:hypothetical protein